MLFNLGRFSKLILGEITDIKTYNNNFFLALSLSLFLFRLLFSFRNAGVNKRTKVCLPCLRVLVPMEKIVAEFVSE